ncbi:hypothetical protein SmJEL517_g01797 [Synchytrium microbalum]|uniref:Choline/carnitine acyltransferase domain-containing protein n=1 Tax=Synchytrium microbalum TaxID=1806994 RepID=A0A507CEJ8_9FUNG|nr:uncharacterized protein SmJEL517_g01797 [Synchytrium microbalum]TPX36005.1 hypothetical protein SmJEL517_g01797 [Synchytrium microbalum]
MEADSTRTGPLSMDQYQWLFNTCRIPKAGTDVIRVSDKIKNNHIIVSRNGKFYSVSAVHASGVQLNTAELETRVLQMAGQTKDVCLGSLTANNRDAWAQARCELLESSVNLASLDQIESASFMIVLENGSPESLTDVSRSTWLGDGRNRWNDVTCQYLIYENGKAGFVGEHSMIDGTSTGRMVEFIIDSLDKGKINYGPPEISSSLPLPTKLGWELNESLLFHIKSAEWAFEDLNAREDMKVLGFHEFGKQQIKKFNVSPDAFVQMAIQLGYYKMYGYCKPTYESAQTRKYAYGRTETCRTVSVESVAWCKAMGDPTLPMHEKAELLLKAITSHVKRMGEAVDAKGVDRHLLGLKHQIKSGEEIPRMFADPEYDATRTWILSTSQVSSECFEGYGWSQVCANAYGIPYCVKNNSLLVTVTCLKQLNASALSDSIATALREMRALFAEASAVKIPVDIKPVNTKTAAVAKQPMILESRRMSLVEMTASTASLIAT